MPHRFLLWVLMTMPFAGIAQLSKDSLLQIIAANKKDAEHVRAQILLASEYLRTDIEKAKAYTYAGIPLARSNGSTDFESSFYSLLTTIHTNAGNPDSALHYLQLMKELVHRYPASQNYKVHLNYYSTAGLFYKKRGEFKTAFPYLVQAAKLAEETGSKEMAAGQYLNIGNTYMQVGDYQKALHYHLRALKLFTLMENKRGIAFCYQSISIDFTELKQYSKALDYARQALQYKLEANDKRGIGSAYTTLGEIYNGQRQHAQALQYFTKALGVAREMGLKSEEGKAALGIGQVFAARNDAEEAKQMFETARQLFTVAADSAGMVKAEKALMAFNSNLLQATQKEELLVSNLQGNIRRGDYNDEIENYRQLATHYEASNNFEKALEYNKKYYEKKDSLANAQVQLSVAQLEQQYKAELKENQIQLLKKDQQLIQARLQRQQSLQWAGLILVCILMLSGILFFNRYKALSVTRRQLEMEKIRNGIARDLHDDIGSTLSSIHILSKVLLQQAGSSSGQYNGLKKISAHAAAMMESIGDIVWAVNPQNDTVEQVVFKMKEFAAEILDPLNIRYTFIEKGNLAAIKLDAGRRKDLFLIFKEAINNAAKYSYCCEITIVLENDGHNLHVHVHDNGKGFDEAAAKRGNGLYNMKARAGSMQAEINYHSAEGAGTTVQLAIPSHD